MQTQQITGGLAVTAMWEAREGEADAVADILAPLRAAGTAGTGVKLFLVHRALENPAQFLFYELFEDEAAFAAHQQTAHFKALILGEGVPRLQHASACSTRCCDPDCHREDRSDAAISIQSCAQCSQSVIASDSEAISMEIAASLRSWQ